LAVGGCEGGEDLLTVHLDVFRSRNPQSDLVAPHLKDRNYHVMADHDALVNMPRQYQQSSLLPWAMDGA
jgi:hypothetical protein